MIRSSSYFRTVMGGPRVFDFSAYRNRMACVSSTGRAVSYGELDELAGRICALMEPHALVFCLCSNTVGTVAGYVAFLRNNDAALMLEAGMGEESYLSLFRTYRPRYVWAPENCRLVGAVAVADAGPVASAVAVADASIVADGAAAENASGPRKLLALEGYVLWDTGCFGTGSSETGCSRTGRLVTGTSDTGCSYTQVAEELALMLTTSGSTGSPKVVRLSKKNLLSNALAIISYLHITDKERPVLGLPMNYAFGLSIVNSHLMCGATLLLTEHSFVEREFLEFAVRNGFTSYSGVPFAFEIIKKLEIWKRPMPSLRTLTMAGGMPDKDLVRFFDDALRPLGKRLYVMYGQAEATARISYLEPELIPAKPGSIGKAIPGGELSLEDEDGELITSPFVIGELVYRGDNVCLGYAERAEDLMRGDDNKGVIHTGDMGYRDDEGFYYISGRKARFVKLFGVRLSLDHIETLLLPMLGECACVGDDSRITVYTTCRATDGSDVIELLSRRTKVPRKAFSLIFVDRIPRAKNGKVLYANLINR